MQFKRHGLRQWLEGRRSLRYVPERWYSMINIPGAVVSFFNEHFTIISRPTYTTRDAFQQTSQDVSRESSKGLSQDAYTASSYGMEPCIHSSSNALGLRFVHAVLLGPDAYRNQSRQHDIAKKRTFSPFTAPHCTYGSTRSTVINASRTFLATCPLPCSSREGERSSSPCLDPSND